MSEKNNSNTPFFALGDLIRKLRSASMSTHEEVSGAIEIEVEHLKAIEQGTNRPSEEILLMLIAHLKASDEQAERLWQLAGYAGDPDIDEFVSGNLEDSNEEMAENGLPPGLKQLPGVISMGISVADPRVVYTDLAKVEINDFGVIMNFHQLGGAPDAKPLAVAKVGMSREHAERIIKLLQTTLAQYDAQSQQRMLPSAKQPIPKTTKKSESPKPPGHQDQ